MWYLATFLACLLVDSIPFIAPPAWTAMVLLQVKFDLNVWGVLVLGVAGSAAGRLFLSYYIPKFSDKVMKKDKNKDLEFVGKKLSDNIYKSSFFVFLYTLTPLSTTVLFTASGLAKIRPLYIVPPFFVGKFISDAVMVASGKFAKSKVTNWKEAITSWQAIVVCLASLIVISLFLFIDWRELIVHKKLQFKFNIWRHLGASS